MQTLTSKHGKASLVGLADEDTPCTESTNPIPTPRPVSVLFVCLGNICRSTMAEGVFQSLTTSHPLVSKIDSCGTGAYHVGDGPDSRTMSTLRDHKITSYRHSARKFHTRDFTDFDYILAMDDENLEDLMELRKREVKKKGGNEGVGQVMLFGEFGGKRRIGGRRKLEKGFGGEGRGEEVQDPYYGGRDGFETTYVQSVKFSKVFVEMLEKGELS